VTISVQVECYSGHTYAQEPRVLLWQGERYQVERIIHRWRTPQGPGFRVEICGISDSDSQPSKIVELAYLEREDEWTLTVQA
jgi:hypothetical protein